MAFLGKGNKDDLIKLATELELDVDPAMKMLSLKKLIVNSENYEEQFVKEMLTIIIEERKTEEEERKRRDEQVQNYFLPINIKNLIHKYDKQEDISLYLITFERQIKRAGVPREYWNNHLLGLLPYEITEMIAREPEENVYFYEDVKKLLLHKFKLSPEKFRQLFVKHQKMSEKTWSDYYHELRNYFDGWIAGLNVNTFEKLRNLMIVDQIKKRIPLDFKEYYLDEWGSITCPQVLADKIEEYEDLKKTIKPKINVEKPRFNQDIIKESESVQKHPKEKYNEKNGHFKMEKPDYKVNYNPEFEKRRPLRCYECNSTEHLRPQCPELNKQKSEFINTVAEVESSPLLVAPYTQPGKVNGIECEILRDTGATIDLVCRRYVSPADMTSQHVWVQQPLDLKPICLPVAEVILECSMGNVVTRAAVIPNDLDRGRYLLGNRTASLLNINPSGNDQINAGETKKTNTTPKKKKIAILHKNVDSLSRTPCHK